MTDSLRIAIRCFAIALVAFGILQCISGQIITGRPPAWPAAVPGENIVAYFTGLWFIFNGILIFANKKIQWLIPTAFFIFGYCAFRNLYLVLSQNDIGVSLTNFGKGITLASGLLFITTLHTEGVKTQQWHKHLENFFTLCCYDCLGWFLISAGVQHFIFADFVKFLIPTWIPFSIVWTYATGIALAIIGVSLVTGIKRQLTSKLGAAMIVIWIIILHIPRALSDLSSQNEVIAVFEALAFSSLLFMIAKAPLQSFTLNSSKKVIIT